MAEQVVWHQQEVLNNAELIITRNLTRAAMLVQRKVIESISVGQPVRRTRSGGVVGLNPSRPGEPPHVLLGSLRRSVTYKVFKYLGNIVAIVGSPMVYARRLEMGFIGTDSAGRNYNQLPRPYLKPAVVNNRAEILQIVTKG